MEKITSLNPTCEGGGFRSPPLAEMIIAPNSANKTSFLVLDFMDMVIRQLFVKKNILKVKGVPPYAPF